MRIDATGNLDGRLITNARPGPAPHWFLAFLFIAPFLNGCSALERPAAQRAFEAKYQALLAEENHFTPLTGQAFAEDTAVSFWEEGHWGQYVECKDLLYRCLAGAKNLRQARVACLLGCFGRYGVISKGVDWLAADMETGALVRLIARRGYATSAYYRYRFGGRPDGEGTAASPPAAQARGGPSGSRTEARGRQ